MFFLSNKLNLNFFSGSRRIYFGAHKRHRLGDERIIIIVVTMYSFISETYKRVSESSHTKIPLLINQHIIDRHTDRVRLWFPPILLRYSEGKVYSSVAFIFQDRYQNWRNSKNHIVRILHIFFSFLLYHTKEEEEERGKSVNVSRLNAAVHVP